MPPDTLPAQDLIRRIAAAVGADAIITEPLAIEPYVTDWRGRFHGATSLVVRPGNTAETAAVVALCAESGTPVVPQGGNTSLCGGSVPHALGNEIVVSVSRMNRVRSIDLANDTITVEAGCTLANLQQAARENERFFPLSLASEGSCQIGGNLSTNAGGTAVLRYGNMRELVLGLEVVLPDGRVWDGLRGLRKDNTGYDLKQLFIGAEGTLGIITAAVLKLFPCAKSNTTALVALHDPAAALRLLQLMRGRSGDRLTGFEVFSRICLELVLNHIPGSKDPFAALHPWYVLIETRDILAGSALRENTENALAEALAMQMAADVVIAENQTQANALWALRENISEAQRSEGPSIKHDVSVPLSRVPEFIEQASERLRQIFPGIRVVAFGHFGDGNIHFNVSQPLTGGADFLAQSEGVNRIVHDLVAALNGSISAEHGLGQLKRDEIKRYKSTLELDLMRALKRAFDPNSLMNPGKVI